MALPMALRKGLALFGSVVLSVACGGSHPPGPTAVAITPPLPEHAAAPEHAALPSPTVTAPKPTAPTPAASPTNARPKAVAAKSPAEPPPPVPVWRVTEGIATPESVLYDATLDRYLVSNINGSPVEADNNGYIAELSPDGKITKPKLVEGGAGKTKLDAPKGMGIYGNVLWVTDVAVVRRFDAKTGAPKGDIPIKDAVFLNDIAITPDGHVYVSDSGLKVGASGLEPAGGDAVYVIDRAGKVKTVAKTKELNGPNGLLLLGTSLYVNTSGADEIYKLDDRGAKSEITHLPAGGLDGLAVLGETVYCTSWKAASVFKGKLGGTFQPAVWNVRGSADVGIDPKRSRLLVPRFLDNAVEVYDIK